MKPATWATIMQWSRLGTNAALFLIVARFLTLEEIGAFATALAPIRLVQVLFKSGILDAYIISDRTKPTQDAFLFISLSLGLFLTAVFAISTRVLPFHVATLMAGLSLIPLLHSFSTIPEATLRRSLRLKALALRTLFAQFVAALMALLALRAGWGAGVLVVFALTNAFVTSALSVALAPILPSAWPLRSSIRAVLPDIVRVTMRDLAGSVTLPLVQMAVGPMLGLPAAGAFQIASRVLSLLDTLAISPIRYIALPRFSKVAKSPALQKAVLDSMRLSSLIASLIYFGAMAVAPDLLTLAVGPAHSTIAAPLLPAFCLLGLTGALAMPLNQSLTAIGATHFPLNRALATLIMTSALAIPALEDSVLLTVSTLPLASVLVLFVYYTVSLPRLRIEKRSALKAIAPPLSAGAIMATALTTSTPSLQGLAPLSRLTLQLGLGVGFYSALVFAFYHLPRRTVTS